MADDSVMAALDAALKTYKTGGDFDTQRASQLEGLRKKYTTGAKSNLVSSGLQGTTISASIPAAFEQEVGGAYRTETERLRSGSEMSALLAKAGFMEAESERQLKIDMQDKDIDARNYQSSMDAAAAVHGGGGGGGGSGGGTGRTFDTGTSGADMWARKIQGSSGSGGGGGGATTHVGGSGAFNTGGYGSGGSGSYGGGDVDVEYGVRSGGDMLHPGTDVPTNRGYTDKQGVYHAPVNTGGGVIL